MAAENVSERPLFGGAVSTVFSTRFQVLDTPTFDGIMLSLNDNCAIWFEVLIRCCCLFQDLSMYREVPDHQV